MFHFQLIFTLDPCILHDSLILRILQNIANNGWMNQDLNEQIFGLKMK
jgi:hypothetical protein